jgi:hypothetical protein
MPTHPPLRTEPLKQCLAFSKEHRRCRLQRMDNKKTCFVHRNYYIQWIQNIFPTLKYIYWESMTLRMKREIEFQLKFQYVKITQEDIIREFWNTNQTDGYETLILYHAINPLWCPRLFDLLLDKYIYRIIYSNGLTPSEVQEYHNLLESFISLEVLDYVFSYIHFRCIWLTAQQDEIFTNLSSKLYMIWNITLSSPAWKLFLHIPFDIDDYFHRVRNYILLKNTLYNAMTNSIFTASFQHYLFFVGLFLKDRLVIEKNLQSRKIVFHDELIYTITQKNWRVNSYKE